MCAFIHRCSITADGAVWVVLGKLVSELLGFTASHLLSLCMGEPGVVCSGPVILKT